MTNRKYILKIIVILFALNIGIFFVSMPEAFGADMVKGTYSGWGLGEAFSDLARKGELNIVGDFGHRKIVSFNLKGETYIEEAIGLLAKSNGFQLRRNDEIWLAIPNKDLKKQEQETAIVKHLSFKSVEDIKDALSDMRALGVNIWFPPAMNGMVLVGCRSIIDEMKKLIEVLDTPDHSLKMEYSVVDASKNTLASCNFQVLNNLPYRLVYESKLGLSFEINGIGKANDDGVISVNERIRVNFNNSNYFCNNHSISEDKAVSTQQITINGKKLMFNRRISMDYFKGKLMSANTPKINHFKTTNVALKNIGIKKKSDGFIVISELKAPLLDKPILLNNVDLVNTIEKLASEEKIPVICDEVVKGKVSAYCYAKRLDKQDLIKSIAKLKGFGVFKNENGYIISSPRRIGDLNLKVDNAYISPVLKRINVSKALRLLTDWLDSVNASFKIIPIQGNRLKIIANKPFMGSIKLILEEWGSSLPIFKVGMQMKVNNQNFKKFGMLSALVPVKKVWGRNGTKVHAMLKERFSSFGDGLKQFSYSVNAVEKGSGRWMLQSSMAIPNSSPFSIFKCEGCFGLELKLVGAIEVPFDTVITGTDRTNSFDDAFDCSF